MCSKIVQLCRNLKYRPTVCLLGFFLSFDISFVNVNLSKKWPGYQGRKVRTYQIPLIYHYENKIFFVFIKCNFDFGDSIFRPWHLCNFLLNVLTNEISNERGMFSKQNKLSSSGIKYLLQGFPAIHSDTVCRRYSLQWASVLFIYQQGVCSRHVSSQELCL